LITLKDYEILAPRQIMLFLVWSRALIGVNKLASNVIVYFQYNKPNAPPSV